MPEGTYDHCLIKLDLVDERRRKHNSFFKSQCFGETASIPGICEGWMVSTNSRVQNDANR